MKRNDIIEVTKDVKWIGILDYDIVTFDIVMETKFGTTYNSYFIDADKKAIIETSKETFKDEYLDKIRKVVDPTMIEYIILDHTEPDHSGNLKHLLKLAPNAKVVASGSGIRYLTDMINEPFEYITVKDGDVLSLGNKTLRFISAPNLHWPDSIYTYLEEDKLLFTCDSFGAHYCNAEMWDDKVGDYNEAFKYYFDVILKPFSKFMLRAIDKLKNYDINMICPGHGPILRSTWRKAVELSEKFSKEYIEISENNNNNVLVAYVSAYGYTSQMADAIEKGLNEAGIKNVEKVDIENISFGELDSKLTIASGLVIGSPTINQNTLLPIYKLFAAINPIRDKGKPAVSFGSYGWSGEAVKIIENQLKLLKLDVFMSGVSEKFIPSNGKENKFIDLGRKFGEYLLKREEKEN